MFQSGVRLSSPMAKFLAILTLIFASTAPPSEGSFVSCNQTVHPHYEVCKPAENSSALVGVFRAVEKGSWVIADTTRYVIPIDVIFYSANNLSCTTPAIIEATPELSDDLVGLRSLCMECTRFQGSTNPFRNSFSLSTLILIDNKYTEFPGEFCGHFAFLKLLSVQQQNIRALSPASFAQMTDYLEYLNLRYIQLEIIEPMTFARLWNLKSLDLRNNRLQILRPDMFDGLDLTALYVGDNRISVIKPGTFAGVSGLQKLFLENNRLGKLPDRIFSDLKNLTMLTLNGNDITNDHAVLFDGLDKLKVIYWGYNGTVKIEREESFLVKILSFTPIGWLMSKIVY